ncbi:unnamed protein product, partial [Prunus brigantina]
NFLVGHPSWDCSSPNSLNFGVPMESETSEVPKGLVLDGGPRPPPLQVLHCPLIRSMAGKVLVHVASRPTSTITSHNLFNQPERWGSINLLPQAPPPYPSGLRDMEAHPPFLCL